MSKTRVGVQSFLLATILALPTTVSAQEDWTVDSGKIEQLVANTYESILVGLVGGFPAAAEKYNCAKEDIAGFTGPKPAMTAFLLAAHASNSTVRMSISGCEGPWLKVIDVYLLSND